MTLPIQHFDTDAMRQIASYQAHELLEDADYVAVRRDVWKILMADHLAAADHIDLLEFALKQRAA